MPPGAMLPPFASPAGPELSFDEVVSSFVGGTRSGHCPELHIEDDMLLADRMIPLSVRVGAGSLLVRVDVPPSTLGTKQTVENALQGLGLHKIESDPAFGDVAAIQVSGIRGGQWDLWGRSEAEAVAHVRQAAAGSDDIVDMGPADLGAGMTLDDLIESIGREHPG